MRAVCVPILLGRFGRRLPIVRVRLCRAGPCRQAATRRHRCRARASRPPPVARRRDLRDLRVDPRAHPRRRFPADARRRRRQPDHDADRGRRRERVTLARRDACGGTVVRTIRRGAAGDCAGNGPTRGPGHDTDDRTADLATHRPSRPNGHAGTDSAQHATPEPDPDAKPRPRHRRRSPRPPRRPRRRRPQRCKVVPDMVGMTVAAARDCLEGGRLLGAFQPRTTARTRRPSRVRIRRRARASRRRPRSR